MTKVLVLYKQADLDWEGYRRYWRETHGPMVATIPGLRRYVQSHIPEQGALPCDGVAELWFDDFAAVQQAQASPEFQAAVGDLANFADTTRSGMTVVDEVRIT